MSRSTRAISSAFVVVAALVVAGCGGGSSKTQGQADATPTPSGAATPASSAGPTGTAAGATFGTQPCGKLVSFEEIAAATGTDAQNIDVVSDTECDYLDANNLAVIAIWLESDPSGKISCTSPDGTYLGKPVEKLSGIGDSAIWSETAGSLCFIKGTHRVKLSLGTSVSDPKGVTSELATKAAGRVSS
jgi:hypothetical protein